MPTNTHARCWRAQTLSTKPYFAPGSDSSLHSLIHCLTTDLQMSYPSVLFTTGFTTNKVQQSKDIETGQQVPTARHICFQPKPQYQVDRFVHRHARRSTTGIGRCNQDVSVCDTCMKLTSARRGSRSLGMVHQA